MHLTEQGEKLILRSPDPSVAKAVGYRRYLIGLDLGQASDPSAFSVILDERVPYWSTAVQQELHARRRVVVRAERLPGLSYTEIARITRNLMIDSALHGRSHLIVDAGGPGRAFCDVLTDKFAVEHTRMQIVGGDNENETVEPGRRFHNVGKGRLLGELNGALHTGTLTLGNFPARDELALELDSFQINFTKAGNMKIEGGTAGGHADMAMATAQALWLSDSKHLNGFVGQSKVVGWY